MRSQKQYFFDPFRLDPVNQQLWQDEREIPLRRKTFEVLRYLVEHPGELVAKTALLDAVWAGVIVNDSMPASSVAELRALMGDEATTPRFIQTVYGRGYRFIARVTTAAASGPTRPGLHRSKHEQIVVGREAELALMRGWFESVLGGERRVIFIAGEPGMGKTTFVRAFLGSINQEAGVRIACGQCIERYGAGEPYMPALEALTRLGQEAGGECIADVLNRLAPSWLAQMPALQTEGQREHLRPGASGISRQRMLREMTQALEAITTDFPLVLFLEDLHWSDDSTLELISAVARRTEAARLLIIGTFRPVEMLSGEHPLRAVKEELELHCQCEELRLGFLSEKAIAEYLRIRFSDGDAERWAPFAPVIHHRTEGNPLFVVNLVDYLVTQGVLNHEDLDPRAQTSQALAFAKNDVPRTILQLIERNLERLNGEEQMVLEAASVAGNQFSAPAVGAALERPVSEIEICCEHLSRREHFIQADGERAWPDGTRIASFRFLHSLYQGVLYSRVSVGRRAELHRRIGEHQQAAYRVRAAEIAAELAHHFRCANESSRAIEYLQIAGEQAFQRGASVEMDLHNSAALELLDRLPGAPKRDQQRLEILLGLATARLGSKGFAHPDTIAAFSTAGKLGERLGEGEFVMAALGGLSSSALMGGRIAEGELVAERLMCLAKASGDRRLLCLAHTFLAQPCLLRGRYLETRSHVDSAMRYLQSVDCENSRSKNHGPPAYKSAAPIGERMKFVWDAGQVSALLTAWQADVELHLGFPDNARRLSSQAIRMAEQRGQSYYLAGVHACACILYDLLRDAPAILAHAEALIPLAEENPAFACYAHYFTARSLLRAGQLSKAMETLRKVVKLNDSTKFRLMRAGELQTEAELFAIAGGIDDALALAREALCEAEDFSYSKPPAMILLADLLALRNKPRPEVEAAYCAALDCARDQDNRLAELEGTTHFARWLQSRSRGAEAYAMLSKIYNWFTEGFDTLPLTEAKELLDQLKERRVSSSNCQNSNRELRRHF